MQEVQQPVCINQDFKQIYTTELYCIVYQNSVDRVDA